MSGTTQRLIVAVPVGDAQGTTAAAAIALLAAAGSRSPAALIIVGAERPRPATLVAPVATRDLEGSIAASAGPDVVVRSRGRLCVVNLKADDECLDSLAAIIAEVPEGIPCALVLPPAVYREVAAYGFEPDLVLLHVDSDAGDATAAVAELAETEACGWATEVEVLTSRPGRLAGRHALAGRAERKGRRVRRGRRFFASESGQATPLVLGAIFVLVLGTVALVAIAGAITGKARAQTVADLSALSAARSMKDDLPRLLAPPTLPNGLPNPVHMPKYQYLARARLSAVRIAVSNGASPLRVSVSFPDSFSFAPVRTKVTVRSTVKGVGFGGSSKDWAEARVGAPVSMGAVPSVASGGGYSGPLAERQGQGMRPDVATAFDTMAAAAGAAGVTLAINSGFRSDAEQAALFAANPNPTMVAPPGQSLHRCGTELDIGPPGAYGWLAANATRFGFVQRYSWEPWHYGFTSGPEPCSAAGDMVGTGDPGNGPAGSLPSFVPKQYRRAIMASAMKWGVSAALLAAQLYAESNFDPNAGSPAGAQGIAQFMPSTAVAYGLRDPYDPDQAIDAQGHLMSDLMKQFGSPAIALAAYNAGPGAVSPCNCIPDYPETQAYVAKILALLGGIGSIAPMPMEVELVK